jgi:protein-tyrosine-phosphatase
MNGMAANTTAGRPSAVLFACNFNRVRSAMAEALLKQRAGTRIFVDSCGLRLPPDDGAEGACGADIFAQIVMAEVGVSLADHRAKTFDELDDASFDLVVSLTPQSQHRAVEMARGRAAEIEYWPVFDPTLAEGSREARLAAYRAVRDDLSRRIDARFAEALAGPIDLPPPGAL